MVHGTAGSFLIARLEPAGAAVFAMLKCGGGDTFTAPGDEHAAAIPSYGEAIFWSRRTPPPLPQREKK